MMQVLMSKIRIFLCCLFHSLFKKRWTTCIYYSWIFLLLSKRKLTKNFPTRNVVLCPVEFSRDEFVFLSSRENGSSVIRKLCYQQMNIGGLECCFTIGGGKKTGTKIAGRLYFLKFVCRNIFFYLLKR